MFKHYFSNMILLSGIIVGGLLGAYHPEFAKQLKPIGQLFLNLLFVSIVPLVFLSISASIARIEKSGSLKKIMISTLLVFFLTSIIIAMFAYLGTVTFNPLTGVDKTDILSITKSSMDINGHEDNRNTADLLVQTFSVGDFSELLNKSNLLALIIFSILFGSAAYLSKERGKPVVDFLSSASDVMLKFVSMLMYAAPVGLGCYFAYSIANLGPQIMGSYLKVFLLYLSMALIYYFIANTVYAYIAGSKKGVKLFWSYIFPPSITAIATSSSAACIPVSLLSLKKMGVPDNIAETVVPLGTNIHKDGSVMGGVIKIVFLMTLLNYNPIGIDSFFLIIGIALLVGIVMAAIQGGNDR